MLEIAIYLVVLIVLIFALVKLIDKFVTPGNKIIFTVLLWGLSLFLGYLIDLQGINILLWVLLIAQAIIFFLSNTIPETQEIHHKKNHVPIWKIIKTPSVVALLIGCTLMVSAHGVLYNFYSIYLI